MRWLPAVRLHLSAVFQMTDAGVAHARSGDVEEDQLPLAQEARDQCPAQAIEAH